LGADDQSDDTFEAARADTMTGRYSVRRDKAGWAVFDVWTSQVVTIAGISKAGMDERAAEALAALLNQQASRQILQ
jgi:hypothetical protein